MTDLIVREASRFALIRKCDSKHEYVSNPIADPIDPRHTLRPKAGQKVCRNCGTWKFDDPGRYMND